MGGDRNTSTNPYVVGVDDSISVLNAARWIAGQACRAGAPVRLVHAYRGSGAPKSGTELLQQVRAAVLDVSPDAVVELYAGRGDVAEVIVEQSRSARMLVLGTHPVYEHGSLLTGSASVRIAGAAMCPVVIARGRWDDDPPPTRGPVVVGVDGAPHSEHALSFAFQEAVDRAAPLVALHVSQPAGAVDSAELRCRLGQWLVPWLDKYPEVAVSQQVVCDKVVRALLHFASFARLLVLGNRGPDPYRSLVLGGTGQHLIHHAAGPIAVVRADIST